MTSCIMDTAIAWVFMMYNARLLPISYYLRDYGIFLAFFNNGQAYGFETQMANVLPGM